MITTNDHTKIILDVATALNGAFPWNKRPFSSMEYYQNATWLRLTFDVPRNELIEKVVQTNTILQDNNINVTFDRSWKWRERNYGQHVFSNPDVTYQMFITASNMPYVPQEITICDTTDDLYDCDLFSLRKVLGIKQDYLNFTNFERTSFGYNITFYTQKSVKEFYINNPFNRVMDVVEEYGANNKKQYVCKIFMNDKVPEQIPVVKFNQRKKNGKKAIPKNFTKSELIQSALAKLTDEEKEALGVLYYMDL